jgi:hypothetical protein
MGVSGNLDALKTATVETLRPETITGSIDSAVT